MCIHCTGRVLVPKLSGTCSAQLLLSSCLALGVLSGLTSSLESPFPALTQAGSVYIPPPHLTPSTSGHLHKHSFNPLPWLWVHVKLYFGTAPAAVSLLLIPLIYASQITIAPQHAENVDDTGNADYNPAICVCRMSLVMAYLEMCGTLLGNQPALPTNQE